MFDVTELVRLDHFEEAIASQLVPVIMFVYQVSHFLAMWSPGSIAELVHRYLPRRQVSEMRIALYAMFTGAALFLVLPAHAQKRGELRFFDYLFLCISISV